jgi:hypothetical protein
MRLQSWAMDSRQQAKASLDRFDLLHFGDVPRHSAAVMAFDSLDALAMALARHKDRPLQST